MVNNAGIYIYTYIYIMPVCFRDRCFLFGLRPHFGLLGDRRRARTNGLCLWRTLCPGLPVKAQHAVYCSHPDGLLLINEDYIN